MEDLVCKCGHDRSLHPAREESVLSLCEGYADINSRCPCARFVSSKTVSGRCRECNQIKGIGFFIDYDPPTEEYVCRSCYLARLRQSRRSR